MTREHESTVRRGLQFVVAILGAVAFVFGMQTVLFGADPLPGGDEVSASVDSEMRFYAAWYVVAGVLALWSVRRIERAGTIVRALAAGAFIAACGRVISFVTIGRPSTTALVLMAIEFLVPLVILPWQSTVEAHAS